MRRFSVLRLHAGELSAGLVLVLGAAACGGEGEGEAPPDFGPYASSLEAFSPGPSAGFGQDGLPDVVLGPPGGTFDVLSLGVGGQITVGFDFDIVDEPGPDLVVFENAFAIGGDPELTFAEPARVEVSEDGERFVRFDCDARVQPFSGCAGVQPTGEASLEQLDAQSSGGDLFDLIDVGLARVRFVRLVDTSTVGEGTSAGFDLDAVGAFHRGDR